MHGVDVGREDLFALVDVDGSDARVGERRHGAPLVAHVRLAAVGHQR